jgi:hypothetical protein
MMPAVRGLEDDFYSSDARHTARDLVQMVDIAASQFKAEHPRITDEAVQALAWCYTFDYK